MISDSDLPHQADIVQQQPPRSFKLLILLTLIAAVLLTAILAGTGGYLLGIRTSQRMPQGAQSESFQLSPTTRAQTFMPTTSPISPQIVPTDTWKIYRNERLGFEFKYFAPPYSVMEETTNTVSFGSNGFPYLTISTNQITDYKSLKPCEYGVEPHVPCLRKWDTHQDRVIFDTTLGGVNAISFDLVEGVPDGTYRIVQTTGSPKLEAKMFVSGGGLGWQFNQMLSTFKFIGDM
jgi:hypothetical protein